MARRLLNIRSRTSAGFPTDCDHTSTMGTVLTKEQARRDAEELLDEYWDGFFPVDPAAIAAAMGIEVFVANLGETSGLLIQERMGQPEIYLNVSENEQRQNFTCAHEVGHYVDRQKSGDAEYSFRDVRGKRWANNDTREWYAEHFAANLLMPQAVFIQRATQLGGDVNQLSRLFGVSAAAIRTRARGLQVDVWG